ncbi:MAG TPA: hypothetical protein DCW90_10340 [Lachnospiraceae bacterium]|nr:hypothetical protein [Lachnospiraceae bacterium]
MIKIDNIQTYGWEGAFRGMRAPLQSWAKSDSYFYLDGTFSLGEADLDLAKRLVKAGTEHRKFLRFIHVQMDIVAPSQFVAEQDTYKVATARNSCSFMHKGASKKFELTDFSFEEMCYQDPEHKAWWNGTLKELNRLREIYLDTKDPVIFQEIRNMLPCGYMIRYTYDCSLETLLNMCKQRANHRLPEWRVFVSTMLEKIPYLKDFYEVTIDNK